MIEPVKRLRDAWDVTCSECGSVDRLENCRSFRDAVDAMKRDGWKIGKDSDGQWTHTCEECQ